MVVYASVSPLLKDLCDENGKSRSRYMFPLMVVCVATIGVLPLSIAITASNRMNGLMEAYGLENISFLPTDYCKGSWPIILVVLLWAMFVAPRFTPATPVTTRIIPEANLREEKTPPLSHRTDWISIGLYIATVLCFILSETLQIPAWAIAMLSSALMVVFKVVDHKTALKEIPWDMVLLYVGSLTTGSALTQTGASSLIGNWLASHIGYTSNRYIIGAMFFLIPFV